MMFQDIGVSQVSINVSRILKISISICTSPSYDIHAFQDKSLFFSPWDFSQHLNFWWRDCQSCLFVLWLLLLLLLFLNNWWCTTSCRCCVLLLLFFWGKIVEVVLLLAPWLLSVHSYPIGISKSTQLLKLTPPAKKLKFCLEK